MTDKEKISWRQQAKLWVLQGILLVAAGISLFSTMAGFHTVFFPSSAMVAVLASLLVQGIELVCAERFHLAGCAAFLLSVAFSAMSFINIGTPTSVYMRHAMTTLNSAYSTQLLPDVQSLRIRLQALNADAATTAEETAHAIQLLLAQASVDTSALSEQINKLITAALNAGLKTDPLPLRDHLERYLQLAELNRTVSERVSAEAALLESVEQAAGDPDADAAWQQVKELWSHELSTLRTALAGSVLSTRTKHMETIDELTRQILEGDRTLVQKAITMLWYNHDLTSFAGCGLAFLLDGISIYCIHAACEIRRQIAQSRASSAKAESAA